MDKRTAILEEAIIRLATARKMIEERENTVNAIVNGMKENDVQFFIDQDDNSLIIASLKSVYIKH